MCWKRVVATSEGVRDCTPPQRHVHVIVASIFETDVPSSQKAAYRKLCCSFWISKLPSITLRLVFETQVSSQKHPLLSKHFFRGKRNTMATEGVWCGRGIDLIHRLQNNSFMRTRLRHFRISGSQHDPMMISPEIYRRESLSAPMDTACSSFSNSSKSHRKSFLWLWKMARPWHAA